MFIIVTLIYYLIKLMTCVAAETKFGRCRIMNRSERFAAENFFRRAVPGLSEVAVVFVATHCSLRRIKLILPHLFRLNAFKVSVIGKKFANQS